MFKECDFWNSLFTLGGKELVTLFCELPEGVLSVNLLLELPWRIECFNPRGNGLMLMNTSRTLLNSLRFRRVTMFRGRGKAPVDLFIDPGRS